MKKAAEYDPADYLKTDEDINAYIDAALEDGDPVLVSAVLGDIARVQGMKQVTIDTDSIRDDCHTNAY